MCRTFCFAAFTAALLLTFTQAGAQRSTKPADEKFVGIVTGDNVYVRAGASQNYYPVTKLNKGDLVQVHGDLFGLWYRISPPKGVFSYVSKDYVNVTEDGSEGEINGNRVRVRAASPAGPEDSYRIQTKLNRGDKVKIIGAHASYYKVVPPKDAYLFISREFIQRATQEQIDAATAPPTPPTPPATDTATEATTTATDTAAGSASKSVDAAATEAATAADASADTAEALNDITDAAATEAATTDTTTDATAPLAPPAVSPETAALAKLDQHFLEVSAKPLAEQNLDELLAAYQSLLVNKGFTADQLATIGARVETLRTRKQLQEAQASLAAAKAEIEAKRQAIEAAQTAAVEAASTTSADTAKAKPDAATTTSVTVVPAVPPVPSIVADKPAGPRDYTAVGVLRTSTLYTGQKLPLLYRIVEPSTKLTVAYIRAGEGAAATKSLGQVVGVVGPKKYDAGLRLNIITAQRIDRLGAAR